MPTSLGVSSAHPLKQYDMIDFFFFQGGDGSMDIKTGVFTAITKGYYVVTFSASARVRPG